MTINIPDETFTIEDGKISCPGNPICRQRELGATHCSALGAPMTNGEHVCRWTSEDDPNLYPCRKKLSKKTTETKKENT